MNTAWVVSVVTVIAAAGCGKGSSTSSSSAGSGSAAGSAGSAVMAAGSAGSAAGSGSAVVAAAAPLSPKIKAARCGEPCLFLVDTPFDKLLETYKAECAGMETKDPGFEDCKQLDYMRNCIFAAHGFAFEKKKWQKAFAGKPWYTIDPAFKPNMISPAERTTVTDLNDRGKACKQGLTISAADLARVKAWFAALPKVPDGMPKLVYVDSDYHPAKANELVATVVSELGDEGKRKTFALDTFKGQYSPMASYQTEELPDVLAQLAKGDKVRVIQVAFDAGTVGEEDNPILEGTNVWFVYDAKDTLLAVAASHYLFD